MRMILAKSPEELRKIAQDVYDRGRNNLGVHCFARKPMNILMWSHYAAQHFGFCLQFDTAQNSRTFTQALPVTYEVHYPVINWVDDFRDHSIEGLLRKHGNWKYEKESRIVRPEGAGDKIRFARSPSGAYYWLSNRFRYRAMVPVNSSRNAINSPILAWIYIALTETRMNISSASVKSPEVI